MLKSVLLAYRETDVQDFNQGDYENRPLGEFLETVALKGTRKRAASYAANGTVSDKVGFCAKALEAIKNYEDLSDEAKEVAKRLYEFIAENNE